MKKISVHDRPETYFSSYRFPGLRFDTKDLPYRTYIPIWEALAHRDHQTALELVAEQLINAADVSDEQLACLRLAQAAAELQAGDLNRARRHAGRSLDLFPKQYAANRILLAVLTRRHGFAAAYHQLLNLSAPRKPRAWDEALSPQETNIALAAWSWQLAQWDDVAQHLTRAFPRGLTEMPPRIREEWFRLSLYRGHPEDAAAAAALIIQEEPVEMADELLQTFVQSGWTKEALPLYRDAYAKEPKSELLRRRLVALCIREGQLDEARALATSGALRLAA